jgi:hypothetical protein
MRRVCWCGLGTDALGIVAQDGLYVAKFVPLPDGGPGPAEQSGKIRIGSQLIALDGQSVRSSSFDAIVQIIKSPAPGAVERVFRFEPPEELPESRPLPSKAKKAPKAESSDSIRQMMAANKAKEEKRRAKEDAIKLDKETKKAMLARAISPLHSEIEKVLGVLEPVHLEVVNVTCYYKQRAAMRPANFWWRGLEQNKNSKWWEAKLKYAVLSPEGDRPDVNPVYLGVHRTEKLAKKAIEDAANARNLTDPDALGADSETPMVCDDGVHVMVPSKFFAITVVSKAFRRKSHFERQGMVYQALLDHFHHPDRPDNTAGTRWKHMSFVGPNVMRLPHLKGMDFNISLTCKAPVQWDKNFYRASLTDRLGRNHQDLRTMGNNPKSHVGPRHIKDIMDAGTMEAEKQAIEDEIKADNKAAKEKREKQQKQLQKASTGGQEEGAGEGGDGKGGASESKRAGGAAKKGKAKPPGDKLAKPPRRRKPRTAAEAIKMAKECLNSRSGGVFAHFYHDLTPSMQQLVRREHSEALAKYGLDGFGKKKDKSGTSLEMLAKMYEATDEPPQGDDAFSRYRAECSRVAIMLQRIWRMRAQYHTLRWLMKRQLAALTVERAYRGHVSRVFAHEYLHVLIVAAVIIESCQRARWGRQRAKRIRAERSAFAVLAQRLTRGWLARKFVKWMRKYGTAGTHLQRITRGFLGRQQYARLRSRHWQTVQVLSAVYDIQRMWRGTMGRDVWRRVHGAWWFRMVETPATMLIQRRYRGVRARNECKYRKLLFRSATLIQTTWRACVARYNYKELIRLRDEMRGRMMMQKRGRIYIAKTVVARVKREIYHLEVRIPSAVHMQTAWRAYTMRRDLQRRKDEWAAAIAIQKPYKRLLVKREQQRQWELMRQAYILKMTRRLQRCYRGHRARQLVSERMREQHGIFTAAACVIQACVRAYFARKKAKAEALITELQDLWAQLDDTQIERGEIEEDREDCKADIKARNRSFRRLNTRIRELRRQRIDWKVSTPGRFACAPRTRAVHAHASLPARTD